MVIADLTVSRRPARAAIGLLVALLLLGSGGCAARLGPDGTPLSEDERISAEARRILADDDDIAHEDLEVETRDGVVVVSGFQESLEPLAEALQRISRLRGVLEVVNRVRLIRSRPGFPGSTCIAGRDERVAGPVTMIR